MEYSGTVIINDFKGFQTQEIVIDSQHWKLKSSFVGFKGVPPGFHIIYFHCENQVKYFVAFIEDKQKHLFLDRLPPNGFKLMSP